jgi:hypothetical protein
MGNLIESGKEPAAGALSNPARPPLYGLSLPLGGRGGGVRPSAGRELEVSESRDAGDRDFVQDGVAAGGDPCGRLLSG